MKSKRYLRLLILILILSVVVIVFFVYTANKPYRIASHISGINITSDSKLEKYNSQVNDFDGSSNTEFFFVLGSKDISNLFKTNSLKNFKLPPINGYNFGDEIEGYLKSQDSVFYQLNGNDIMDYSLSIINFKKKKIIIKQVKTYK